MITMAFLAAGSILGVETGMDTRAGLLIFFIANGFFNVFIIVAVGS